MATGAVLLTGSKTGEDTKQNFKANKKMCVPQLWFGWHTDACLGLGASRGLGWAVGEQWDKNKWVGEIKVERVEIPFAHECNSFFSILRHVGFPTGETINKIGFQIRCLTQ